MTSIEIPPELVENVARGSCVLFLGADYSLGETGSPTRAGLAAALARKYDLAPSPSLADVAEAFLAHQPRNRHGLIAFLQDLIRPTAAVQPTQAHQMIVALGFEAVVTAWYDDLMERAYEAAGKSVARVVQGLDVAYADPGRDVIVVKLYGDIQQPDSMVITRRDLMRVESNLAQRLEDVRPFVRLRPIIFIGWDPDDEGLGRLYTAATESLGEHKRRNYIVWPTPTPEHIAWWGEDNVEIIPAEPLPFLRALERLVGQQRPLQPRYQPGRVIGKLPYKFLDYFDREDRDIFCGREVEAPLVYRMALSYPLLTLFGQSGVGKTSLLRAGVVPLLVDEGYNYAYVRILGDPLQAVREGVCEALNLERCEETTLPGFFRATLGDEGRLVIILDQFEEFFIRTSPWMRRQFWHELRPCLGLARPELHFILSLREDFLAELDEARRPLSESEPAPIPTILRDSYRLNSLVADTAYLAIVEPAHRARCTVEPALVEVLLGRAEPPDIEKPERARWSLAEADGRVPPSSLQIVMDRLYRRALTDAGHRPPPMGAKDQAWEPPSLTLTLDLYRVLGGAGRILADYVTSALDQVPGRGGDRTLAVALLKVMVTSQATKAALNDAEMIAGMASAIPGFDPQDAQAVTHLLDTRAALVDLRLMRGFKVGDRILYELAHDHMAAEIHTWIDEAEMAAKLARELLRRELENWRGLGKLVEPTALKLIHERREELKQMSIDELELVFRSALAVEFEVAYWAKRAQEGNVPVDEIAREGLRSEDYRVRAGAVATLGQLGEDFADKIIEMLNDDYPQVRMAAIHALEHLQPDGGWRQYLKHECYVPAGTFTMGDNEGKKDDEKPAHDVYLDAFYIAKHPVTNVEFQRFRDEIGRPFEFEQGKEKHPAVNVSWYDAREYAEWARMRLLTEAEWEKAASWEEGTGDQLPGKRKYPWGDQFDKNKCNTNESGIGGTSQVDTYSPNGDSFYGCAELAGNVWEWTSSLYMEYPYKANDGREDAESSDVRVLRGGGWRSPPIHARCAARHREDPRILNNIYGVRCGIDAES